MNFIKIFLEKHKLFLVIIVCLIFGLGGGLLGEIFASVYLSGAPYQLSPFGNLDYSSGKYGDQGLIIGNANNVTVEQNIKIDETINGLNGSLVGIYKKQKTAKANSAFALDNFYKLDEPVGQGFILTSDGWIVTSLALDKAFADYVVIDKDKKIYQIERAQSDNLTGFDFIQVQSRDFPVRKFAELSSIKKGNLAVNLNWSGLSRIAYVAGFIKKDGLVRSSDSFSEKLVLDQATPEAFKGSVVFNLAGDVLGLIDNTGAVEPMAHFNAAVKSLFKNKIVSRPSLGLNYINLADLANAVNQNNLWQKGAVIVKDQKGVAIKKGGPAEAIGLREGDLIISLNDISLNKDNDLAEILENYAAGDKVSLVISRAGIEQTLEAVLGEQKVTSTNSQAR